MTKCVDAIVVGAGPAGLAMAAALKARGRNAIILEKSDMVVSVWRRHYDRLRLHTDRARSSLPRLPMPKASTPRVQAIEYFEAYAANFVAETPVQRRSQPNSRRTAGRRSSTSARSPRFAPAGSRCAATWRVSRRLGLRSGSRQPSPSKQ
jgi:cation diffusion facilitator CzcD-associated flavoprotein CzcO